MYQLTENECKREFIQCVNNSSLAIEYFEKKIKIVKKNNHLSQKKFFTSFFFNPYIDICIEIWNKKIRLSSWKVVFRRFLG